ncbi:MAG: GNAT family N-acetyltransferase [Candidatus Hodarchaeales archaeon]
MSLSLIIIRKYQSSDRKGVLDVCIMTGYMGEDVRKHFDDHYLFGLLFCFYYIDYEPENCFVAIDERNGMVVGYILSSLNSLDQDRAFTRKMIPKILLRLIFYTSWKHRQSFSTLRHMKRMDAKNSETSYDKTLLNQYPAHLHVNVLPKYHRMGIGTKLINQQEKYLQSRNCGGVHLHTTEQNVKAIPFYKKSGFSILYTSPAGNGLWPDAPQVKSVILGKLLESDALV